MGSTVVYSMFRKPIGKLLQIGFYSFFLKIFLYLEKRSSYRVTVVNALRHYNSNASKDMYDCMGNVLDSAYGVCRTEGLCRVVNFYMT